MTSTRKKFSSLAIDNTDDLVFGRCKYPVTCGNNLVIGDGLVFPEINFTLPPMTQNPQWGAEITLLLKESLSDLYNKTGIANALRVTVVDVRDLERPPILREGKAWEQTYEAFRACAEAGADILSIESVGGKEVHDQALMLEPSIVFNIAEAIIQKSESYERTIAAVQTAIEAIDSAEVNRTIKINTAEKNWFDRLKKDMETIPETTDEAVQYLQDSYGEHFLLESYEL